MQTKTIYSHTIRQSSISRINHDEKPPRKIYIHHAVMIYLFCNSYENFIHSNLQ